MAPLLILFFGFCLVILPTDTEHTHFSIGPWWAGAGIGFLLTALIAVRSIRITHGGLTTQEIKNAARTMRFLQTGQLVGNRIKQASASVGAFKSPAR